MIGLAWREVVSRRRATIGLILGVGVVLLVFFAIEGLWAGVAQTLSVQETEALVVLPKDAISLFGNVMPLSLKATLRGMGAEVVAPQLFTIRQIRPGEPILLRGMPLDDGSAGLARIAAFEMQAGAPLERGDRDAVMIGAEVARSKALAPGDAFKVLGKTFIVKGVFATSSISDSEVWLDLGEAQRLVRSQGYVSMFSVIGPPGLGERIAQRLDVDVVKETEVWESLTGAIASLDGVMKVASVIVAAAAVLGVMNTIFTVVQQRRREIAVMRSVGFGRRAVIGYVLSQSLMIALGGFAVALAGAVILLRFMRMEAMGMTITPVLTDTGILRGLGLTLIIGMLAGLYPALRAARLNIAQTLRGE